jgi:hypothetical protein
MVDSIVARFKQPGRNQMKLHASICLRDTQRKLGAMLILLSLGCMVFELAACQSQGDIVQQENTLAAAGFEVRIANTAERQTMLNRLPPNRFVLRVNNGVTLHLL